ncbi:MAG: MBL fold metallo-hydrolase [Acidobacteriota bacterium]|nr:MBL fold metallo-hydrolase [Acidobacteriota bacterium]
MATIGGFDTDKKGRPKSAAEIVTSSGTRIYLLPVETFRAHVNNVYLIDHPDHPTLFDVGTASSHDQLLARLDEVRARFGVRTKLGDVREAVISHAHTDHFGNAHHIRELGIKLSIHELDARVMAAFEERRVLAARGVEIFLRQAGVETAAVAALIELYRSGKTSFRSLEPDRRLVRGDTIGPGWPLLHVPGHCPGMICLAVDDVVLTADHLLARITPAQFPQSITHSMGLGNYLASLSRLEGFGAFDLGLGGHGEPIRDVSGRIGVTRGHHRRRLEKILELAAGRTVAEIALDLFGPQERYGALLAYCETGAHVEFLHDHGLVTIANLDELAGSFDAAPRYRSAGFELDPAIVLR